MPRPIRRLLLALLGYAALVVALESFVGFAQFEARKPLEIITTDEGGADRSRMVFRFEEGGRVYASAHHWPRRWYRDAVAQERIEAVIDGVRADYRAVPIEDPTEFARLEEAFPLPFAFRALTAFPPRSFLRLDPVE